MNRPFNITISVPSGNPEKLRLVEKTNRLSFCLVFNRAELASVAEDRAELRFTGVYMLVNSNQDALPEIYIGEGESVESRLRSHNKDTKKDFWEWAVVFVNRDNSLHKGHIQHIESALLERANSNKRAIVKNDVNPAKPSLPESVLYEAEDVLRDIYDIVPLLGINAFEEIKTPEIAQLKDKLLIHSKGISAEGYQADGKIIVVKGSNAVMENTPSMSSGFANLRRSLAEQGVLEQQGSVYVFTQDYAFASPSTAAAVVMGRNANGRTEWRTVNGVTLKELQEQGE